MNCKKAKKVMAELYENKKPEKDFFIHIKNCDKCKKEYELILKMKKAFLIRENLKVPSDFNKKIFEKIGFENKSRDFRIFEWMFQKQFAFAKVLVLILFFALILFSVKDQKDLNNYEKITIIDNLEEKNKTQITQKKEVIENREQVIAHIERKEIEQGKVADLKDTEEKSTTTQTQIQPYFSTARNSNLAQGGLQPTEKPASLFIAKSDDKPNENKTPEIGEMKEKFIVKKNVFNPLKNEKFMLKYKVDNKEEVVVKIFNRIGEPVNTLLNEEKQPGIYECVWDGKEANGKIVGAGIYIVYLKIGAFNEKIKVVVIK